MLQRQLSHPNITILPRLQPLRGQRQQVQGHAGLNREMQFLLLHRSHWLLLPLGLQRLRALQCGWLRELLGHMPMPFLPKRIPVHQQPVHPVPKLALLPVPIQHQLLPKLRAGLRKNVLRLPALPAS